MNLVYKAWVKMRMTQHSELQVQGKRCLVMGLGAFGGGIGATQWLAQHGAKEILVTDIAPAEKLKTSITTISPLIKSGVVRLRLGGHDLADFKSAQVVVAKKDNLIEFVVPR